MPNEKTEAEVALQKLGQRLREGFAKKNPVQNKSLETVRDTVREQWEQEQQAEHEQKPSAPNATKDRQQQPPEPDQGR